MYVKITKVEKHILTEIARNDPLWLSELARRLEWSRGAIEKALPRLEKKNLLEAVKIVELPSGVKQVWYDLTMRGLVVILTYENLWIYIDEIAEKKASKLPLVFGKWNYFCEKGVKEHLIAALRWAISEPYTGFYVARWKKESPEIEQVLRNHLTDRVLFFNMDLTSGWSLEYQFPLDIGWIAMGADEWVEILIGDPDLKKYMNENLDHFRERFERYLEDIKLLKMLIARVARRSKRGHI